MGVSLLTMGNGNVKVLGETIHSFSSICDEIVYGDLLIWNEDREILKQYQDRYNLNIVPMPWNALFEHGFSYVLNELADHATNDMVVYANTSEVIEKDFGASEAILMNEECNAFFFTHGKENHRWFRCYNRQELKWSGLIHEQLKGEYRPYHKSIFQFADLEKDMGNSYKAKVLNLLKEYTYFQQYVKIVDHPELMGETDPGWMAFAKSDYTSFRERMEKRPEIYRAIQLGNKFAFLYYISKDKEFENEQFKSSDKIAYQGDKIHLL